MRVPAAVVYLVLAGLVALAWFNHPVAAAVLGALAASTILMMLASGFHPIWGVFYLLSYPVDETDP